MISVAYRILIIKLIVFGPDKPNKFIWSFHFLKVTKSSQIDQIDQIVFRLSILSILKYVLYLIFNFINFIKNTLNRNMLTPGDVVKSV